MYDFARGLGLKKAEARRHVVKARDICGEEGYNSDSSTFQGEINDSRSIMETLSASTLDNTAAVSIPINRPSRQVDGSDKIQATPDVLTRSEDSTSKSIRTYQPSKKRKAKAGGVHNDYDPDEELLKFIGAPVDVAEIGEDAASVSDRTKRPSKKRKAKADSMENDYESALTLLKVPRITAQWLADGINEGKVARRESKKERKGHKRPKIIKHNESEPQGDKEYINELADSQESATKEGGREGEKKGEYPSLNNSSKRKAFIEQHDDQVMAEETLKPRKTRKRKRHRINDMPADAIPSSGDGNKKNSIHQHSGSRETTSDEIGPKQLQGLTHPMIQVA